MFPFQKKSVRQYPEESPIPDRWLKKENRKGSLEIFLLILSSFFLLLSVLVYFTH